MKLPPKERLSSLAVVIALAAVLMVLAVLQYRWSGEVSEASTLRMEAALHSSLLGWRQDLYRELAQSGDAFQFFGAASSKATLAEAAQRYREASSGGRSSGAGEGRIRLPGGSGGRSLGGKIVPCRRG